VRGSELSFPGQLTLQQRRAGGETDMVMTVRGVRGNSRGTLRILKGEKDRTGSSDWRRVVQLKRRGSGRRVRQLPDLAQRPCGKKEKKRNKQITPGLNFLMYPSTS